MSHSFNKGGYLGGRDLLLVIITILLIFQNPPAPKDAKASTNPPGNLIVTVVWPEGPIDVDLWTWMEGEERPVGFSNRSGKYFSLLRDDLGTRNDSVPVNMENAYSRSINPGRVVVNLHCYSCRAGAVPVAVEIAVVHNGTSRKILETTVTLQSHGQEITVVSFEITAQGSIVPGSAHSVFFPMYKAWK